MEKALKILKEPYSATPKQSGGFIFSYTSKDIQNVISKLNEAIVQLQAKDKRIKELEEAMKPKTCEGCKHKPNEGECYYEPCGTCARFFYDHYELKGNA